MGEAICPKDKMINESEYVQGTTKPKIDMLMRDGWAILRQQALSEQFPIK